MHYVLTTRTTLQTITQLGVTHVVVGDGGVLKPFQCPPGVPIVDEDWLKACKAQAKWVDHHSFIRQPAGMDTLKRRWSQSEHRHCLSARPSCHAQIVCALWQYVIVAVVCAAGTMFPLSPPQPSAPPATTKPKAASKPKPRPEGPMAKHARWLGSWKRSYGAIKSGEHFVLLVRA